jgi:putative transposase
MPNARRPSRLRSFDYIGEHEYFVTCCVYDRRSIFVNSGVVDCVRREMLWTCEERAFWSRVSVFMPDHVHFLVRGEVPDAAFLPFMKTLRQRTAVAYRRLKGERLWQSGYYERVLRPSDNWADIASYIQDNPVRAGLIGASDAYPFCYWGHSERPSTTPVTPNLSCAPASARPN